MNMKKDRTCVLKGMNTLYPGARWRRGAKDWYLKLGKIDGGEVIDECRIALAEFNEHTKAYHEARFLGGVRE